MNQFLFFIILLLLPITVKAQEQHPVKFHNPPTLSQPRGYSHIVEVRGGKTVYISGQLSLDKDGNLIGKGDFRAQAKQVFENIKLALEAAGATFNHIIKMNTYLTDMSAQRLILREIRSLYLNSTNPPTSTLVEIKKLALDEALLEIEVIAVIL